MPSYSKGNKNKYPDIKREWISYVKFIVK